MWVITPSWLSESLRSFFYSSSVYSCHLFLISSASVRYIHFCRLLCLSLHEMFPWYLNFSWRDPSSFPFYCFPLFLCTDHWGRLSYLSLLFFGTLICRCVCYFLTPWNNTQLIHSVANKIWSQNFRMQNQSKEGTWLRQIELKKVSQGPTFDPSHPIPWGVP